MGKKQLAIFLALLAAALYAINVPFSKLLMAQVSPAMLAGLLYIGAGTGMGCLMLGKRLLGLPRSGEPLTRRDLPFTVAMVILDIAAPIFLMCGITRTNAANVSLLNNFEIVATSCIALLLFRETISGRLWGAIILVVVSGVLLGFEGSERFVLNRGSLFVLAACFCWGIENNCTRSISHKSSEQIVLIKGLGSGAGGIGVALLCGEKFPALLPLALTMLLGFIAYGLSINCYILAQKELGAAKTSAFYSVAPFLGVGFSFLLLGEQPGPRFYLALALMIISTLIMVRDTLGKASMVPGYAHTHAHRHGTTVHTHEHRHSILSPLHVHLHGPKPGGNYP